MQQTSTHHHPFAFEQYEIKTVYGCEKWTGRMFPREKKQNKKQPVVIFTAQPNLQSFQQLKCGVTEQKWA